MDNEVGIWKNLRLKYLSLGKQNNSCNIIFIDDLSHRLVNKLEFKEDMDMISYFPQLLPYASPVIRI